MTDPDVYIDSVLEVTDTIPDVGIKVELDENTCQQLPFLQDQETLVSGLSGYINPIGPERVNVVGTGTVCNPVTIDIQKDLFVRGTLGSTEQPINIEPILSSDGSNPIVINSQGNSKDDVIEIHDTAGDISQQGYKGITISHLDKEIEITSSSLPSVHNEGDDATLQEQETAVEISSLPFAQKRSVSSKQSQPEGDQKAPVSYITFGSDNQLVITPLSNVIEKGGSYVLNDSELASINKKINKVPVKKQKIKAKNDKESVNKKKRFNQFKQWGGKQKKMFHQPSIAESNNAQSLPKKCAYKSSGSNQRANQTLTNSSQVNSFAKNKHINEFVNKGQINNINNGVELQSQEQTVDNVDEDCYDGDDTVDEDCYDNHMEDQNNETSPAHNSKNIKEIPISMEKEEISQLNEIMFLEVIKQEDYEDEISLNACELAAECPETAKAIWDEANERKGKKKQINQNNEDKVQRQSKRFCKNSDRETEKYINPKKRGRPSRKSNKKATATVENLCGIKTRRSGRASLDRLCKEGNTKEGNTKSSLCASLQSKDNKSNRSKKALKVKKKKVVRNSDSFHDENTDIIEDVNDDNHADDDDYILSDDEHVKNDSEDYLPPGKKGKNKKTNISFRKTRSTPGNNIDESNNGKKVKADNKRKNSPDMSVKTENVDNENNDKMDKSDGMNEETGSDDNEDGTTEDYLPSPTKRRKKRKTVDHFVKKPRKPYTTVISHRTWPCKLCSNVYPSNRLLNEHRKNDHPSESGVVRCTICDINVFKGCAFKTHNATVHGIIREYACLCQEKFLSHHALKIHKRECGIYHALSGKDPIQPSNEKRVLMCDICGQTFTLKGSLVNHERYYHSEPNIACPFCEKKVKCKTSLLYHICTHREISAAYVEENSELDNVEDDNNKKEVKQDLNSPEKEMERVVSAAKPGGAEQIAENEEVQFVCPLCQFKSKKDSYMKNHILTDHAMVSRKKENKDKTFIERRRMYSKTYTPLQYLCSTCGQSNASKAGLADHIAAAHTRIISRTCEICFKGFYAYYAYMRHKRMVHGIYKDPSKKRICDTSRVCDVCGINVSKGSYKKHMDMHNGVFRFKCDVCNKECRSKHDLSVHKRIHTGEKPYSCDICGRKFSDLANLRHHEQRIHKVVNKKKRKTNFVEPKTSDPSLAIGAS